jgi:hypothetical protein
MYVTSNRLTWLKSRVLSADIRNGNLHATVSLNQLSASNYNIHTNYVRFFNPSLGSDLSDSHTQQIVPNFPGKHASKLLDEHGWQVRKRMILTKKERFGMRKKIQSQGKREQ